MRVKNCGKVIKEAEKKFSPPGESVPMDDLHSFDPVYRYCHFCYGGNVAGFGKNRSDLLKKLHRHTIQRYV
ncbi:MAG: hypothetical protein ACLR6B_18180 [Blautia sp.]